MSALSALTATQLNQGTTATASSSDPRSLGRDDFLKILMSQMQHQDPMDPVKDTEFIAQLAQFSQLDGITQLNSNFSQLLLVQGMAQGTNLIGTKVTYTPNSGGSALQGVVQSVQVTNGNVNLMIDGNSVGLGQVNGISA